jgi:Trypsin
MGRWRQWWHGPDIVCSVRGAVTLCLFLAVAGLARLGWGATRYAYAEVREDPTRSTEPRDARIVNGVATTAYPGVGVLAVFDALARPVVNCSATLIGCSTVLTAAHCVCPAGADDAAACFAAGVRRASDLVVFFQHGGFFKVASVAINPEYSLLARGDVAVVKLLRPVSGIAPLPIDTLGSPAYGTSGTIVGFGGVGGTSDKPSPGSGVKRRGKVVTGPCFNDPPNSTHVCWSLVAPLGPAGEDSGTCYGDSGGPLLIDFGSGPTVAGVTSLVTTQCTPPSTFRDTDVFTYREWIEGQSGADLGDVGCGSLPQVGESGTSVVTSSGQLDVFNRSGPLTLSVSPGTALLRVALNGAVVGNAPNVPNEFRLYLKQNSAASAEDFDCYSDTGTSLGFCDVSAPTAGLWYTDAAWHSGLGGTYQLTATLFAGSAAPTPTPVPLVPCIGDCNRNRVVTTNELLLMINVALGKFPSAYCLEGDANADGVITVDELVRAVGAALRGCAVT